jgi:hypothetical protein
MPTHPPPPSDPSVSINGEEDPGAALDMTGTTPDPEPAPASSELIESPMPPSATQAQKSAHQFADGGGAGGAEAYRTRHELRGDRRPLDEREYSDSPAR